MSEQQTAMRGRIYKVKDNAKLGIYNPCSICAGDFVVALEEDEVSMCVKIQYFNGSFRFIDYPPQYVYPMLVETELELVE